MIIGQTILTDSNGDPMTFYSPWFSRGGCGAEFVIDILNKSSAASLELGIQTKNSEDDNQTGTGGVVTIKTQTFTASGTVLAGCDVKGALLNSSTEGLKELVRFRYILSGSGSQEWMHFRMLSPSWIGDGA